ncbi:MAG: CHAT domain-containing protein [Pyrinomonadaceae bacterium]
MNSLEVVARVKEWWRRLYAVCLLVVVAGMLYVASVEPRAQEIKNAEQSGVAKAERARAQELYDAAIEAYSHDEYERVLTLATEGLRIDEKIGSPMGMSYGLNLIGKVHYKRGDYETARLYYQRGLRVADEGQFAFGIGQNLSSLGSSYFRQGNYPLAQEYYERSLQVRRELGDKNEIARALNDLANVFQLLGRYPKTLAYRQEALGLWRQTGNKLGIADGLNDIGWVYDELGDYTKALDYFRQSVTISREIDTKWGVADGIEGIGLIYLKQGKYGQSLEQFREALDLFGKLNNRDEEARTLEHLGQALSHLRRNEEAKAAFERALAIRKSILGEEHPGVASCLNNLAALYQDEGNFDQAETLYRHAVAIYEKVLGSNHPEVASSLMKLASLADARGKVAEATELLTRGNDIREENVSLVLSMGSEQQKLLYMNLFSGEIDFTISFHVHSAPGEIQAARLALTTILRRKGRALDAMSDQIGTLRRRLNPQDRTLLDQLSATRAQLSTLVLGGPGETPSEEFRAAVAKLGAEVERLEEAVGKRSAEFRVQRQPVTVEQVRQAIPADAALVELVSYRPFAAKQKISSERLGPAHYAAYVLQKGGELLWADLGEAGVIDAGVARLRSALKNPASLNFKDEARALDERVMRPVRKLIGNTKQLFLSPDGALNLIPFGALVDENGKYLVENFSVTYLTSGRDLLRLQVGGESRQPPLVMADPLFGRKGNATPPARGARDARARRSGDMTAMTFNPLPGTTGEALALGALLSGVHLLTGSRATETALKQVSSPRILHIATHGFFLPNQKQGVVDNTRGIGLVSGAPPTVMRSENPLLRSGLALAGANRRQGAGGEDGVLTALEMAGLDLWGTKLVVLSACETGVGEVKSGDGVYGLRRALVLAGSETQVMSLWQVSDKGTRDLMIAYYKRLQAGEGRTEALRQVQLEMIRSQVHLGTLRSKRRSLVGPAGQMSERVLRATVDRSHPFFWASFIQSGEWRGINLPPKTQ